jgi:WD40 repeat protein
MQQPDQSCLVLLAHTDPVWAVAVGEVDGAPIAVTGDDDSVRVWDLGTGRTRHVLKGHTGRVSALALGRVDGVPIAVTASYDCTVWVWPLAGRPDVNA